MKLEKNINVRLPEEVLEALVEKADEHGVGYSTYVRQMIYKDLGRIGSLKPYAYLSALQSKTPPGVSALEG